MDASIPAYTVSLRRINGKYVVQHMPAAAASAWDGGGWEWIKKVNINLL